MARRTGTRRNLFCLLLAAVLVMLGSPAGRVGAQGPHEQPLPADPNAKIPSLANNRIYQEAQWDYALRAAPAATIPQGAKQKALAQTQAADAAQHSNQAGQAGASIHATSPIWTNIGPAPSTGGQIGTARPTRDMSGRITALAVDPGNTSHWIAGGAQGGLWSTTDAGTTWTALTDAQASLATGSVAFAPNNAQVIYAGTGEPNNSGDSYAGAGILKSTDGGATWNLFGASTFASVSVSGLLVKPTDPNTVLAGSTFGFAGREGGFTPPSAPALGLYASANGGATWSATPIVAGVVSDLKADPTNFNHQLLAMGNAFGDPSNGLYRSLDGGSTWTQLPAASVPWSAAVTARVGRIAIAIAPSSPSTAYVSVQDALGVTGSTNGGLLGLWRTDSAWAATPTWTQISVSATDDGSGTLGFCGWDPAFSNASNQCWYDQVLSVDPANANTLYAGGIPLWKFDGTGWTEVSKTVADPTHGIHVDQHALVWAGTRLIAGNDGGVWSTTDGGSTWNDHNTNLALTQFYFGASHPSNASFALGGAQDNGSQEWTGANAWATIGGGDGILPIISNTNPNTNWAISAQNLSLQRTTNGGSSFVAAGGGVAGTKQFVSVYAECPTNDNVVIAGTTQMNRSNNFFSSAPGAPTWAADNSGSFSNGITALAFAPSDTTCTTYVFGTRGSSLRLTQNGGTSYTDINAGGAVPVRAITAYAFDPTNANTLYVTISGFNGNTAGHSGHVFKTTNALAANPSWTDVSPPVDLPFNAIVLDPAAPQAIYAGSDLGVWTSPDGGTTWTHFTPAQGMPNVAVFDLKLNRTTNQLVAFTHGRGAFKLTLPSLVLSFTTQPGGAAPGVAFTTQPVVTLSLSGSTVTSFNGAVALSIKAGTGTLGALLGGTTTVNAAAGVATFSGLSINLAGTGYVLTATGNSLNVNSAPFNVAATALAFTTQPGNGLLAKPLPTQPVVTVVDGSGNTVTSFTGQVSLAIKAGTGTAGAVLGGATTVSAMAGVARFINVSINLAGTGYALTASASGFAAQDSAAFTVLPLPDANGDTAVNALDALCILRQVAGLPATGVCPAPLPDGDVNGDGAVGALDALCVLRYVAGLPATAACPFSP